MGNLKQSILDHFGSDFTPFFSRFLKDLKPGGAGNLKALCPFHEDTNPSLSISTKDGLWNCKACEAKGDAFNFYARTHGNAPFPAVLRGIAGEFGIQGGNGTGQAMAEKPIIVGEYSYKDTDGKLLFQTVRYEPKDFRQRRPDGNRRWVYNLQGVELVLYRLPDIIKANEVLIVEGEKDADNLKALGFCATTAPMGAGKWREEYNRWLKGKNIVLLPDNDDPGREHMSKVAASLNGVVASIKLIRLPHLPHKGDVTDFIQHLVSQSWDLDSIAEKLATIIDQAEKLTPAAATEQSIEGADHPPETTHKFPFIHTADILANLCPVEWRIRDILTDYALYYNFGDPGHFKTFIELDRLLCIASGIDYHGHQVKQGTVFYIAGEGYQGIGRRIAAWLIAHGIKAADVPFFVSRTPAQLMDLGALQDVRSVVDAMAKEYGPPAVVHFDTLARNFGEGDENATKDMNAAISNLDRAFGSDFCRGLTHHTGHGNKDRARGSIALHGAADGAFRISLTPSGQIVVECKKMKDAPTAPMMVFDRMEILLQIGDTEDRSYVLELAAEGDEACRMVKPKKAAELKGGLQNALNILRRLYARYEENLRKGGRSCATPSVSFADWRTACMDAGLYKRTDNFRTAAEKLLLHELIRFDEARKYVYLVEMVKEDEI